MSIHQLASIAAGSALTLVLVASPALATGGQDGHGLPWVTIASDSTQIAGYSISCGSTNYTVTQGTVDFRWRMKGDVDLDTGIAGTAGLAIETFTLNDARARNDVTGRTHRVVGQLTVHASWRAGTNVMGDTLAGFTSYRELQHVAIEATRDGRVFVVGLRDEAPVMLVDRGTCSGLRLQG